VPQAGSQNGEVAADARVGLDAADDRLDQHPRREVLPGPLLPLAGGLLQKTLVGGGLHVHVEGGPLGLVDQADEPLEVDRVLEARLRPGVDVAEEPGRLAELAEDVDVVVGQLGASVIAEHRPIAILGDGDAALVGHLEKEQIGDLLDVVAIVDAVVAQRVAEAPEFLDDVGHFFYPQISQITQI
jgi:hypothetical protein